MSDIELKVGRTYRAKKPRESHGLINDRTVLYIGSNYVQYDGPAVALGRHYPKALTSDFLKWADRDVTDELPKGEYARWPPAKPKAECPDCKDTGERDSGGFHPWGEGIMVPCDCRAAKEAS